MVCPLPFVKSCSGSLGDLHFSFKDSRSPNRLSKMALAIGSIMAVVAVLLSHMDKKDEVSIIPRMSLGGKVFTYVTQTAFFFSQSDKKKSRLTSPVAARRH